MQILEILANSRNPLTSRDVLKVINEKVSIFNVMMLLCKYFKFGLLNRKNIYGKGNKRKQYLYRITQKGKERLNFLKEKSDLEFLKERG